MSARLPARGDHLREALADPHHQAVADLAVGLQLLLAAAFVVVGSGVGQYSTSAARVCVSSSALWWASGDSVMMRSKLSPSQSSSSSKVIGLWPGNVLAEFGHHGDRERIEFGFPTPAERT